jgi:hypothetical protein
MLELNNSSLRFPQHVLSFETAAQTRIDLNQFVFYFILPLLSCSMLTAVCVVSLRAAPTMSCCSVCNEAGERHVCMCGRKCARISVLLAHVAVTGDCRDDRHAQLAAAAASTTTCKVCGEALERADDERQRHVAAHAAGLFWCVLCKATVASCNFAVAIDSHFRNHHAPPPRPPTPPPPPPPTVTTSTIFTNTSTVAGDASATAPPGADGDSTVAAAPTSSFINKYAVQLRHVPLSLLPTSTIVLGAKRPAAASKSASPSARARVVDSASSTAAVATTAGAKSSPSPPSPPPRAAAAAAAVSPPPTRAAAPSQDNVTGAAVLPRSKQPVEAAPLAAPPAEAPPVDVAAASSAPTATPPANVDSNIAASAVSLTKALRAAAVCKVCNAPGGAHTCACGESLASIVQMVVHLHSSDEVSECRKDPHYLHTNVWCSICQEAYESHQSTRDRHKNAHETGQRWCVLCMKAVAPFARVLHFKTEHNIVIADVDTPVPRLIVRAAKAAETHASAVSDTAVSDTAPSTAAIAETSTPTPMRIAAPTTATVAAELPVAKQSIDSRAAEPIATIGTAETSTPAPMQIAAPTTATVAAELPVAKQSIDSRAAEPIATIGTAETSTPAPMQIAAPTTATVAAELPVANQSIDSRAAEPIATIGTTAVATTPSVRVAPALRSAEDVAAAQTVETTWANVMANRAMASNHLASTSVSGAHAPVAELISGAPVPMTVAASVEGAAPVAEPLSHAPVSVTAPSVPSVGGDAPVSAPVSVTAPVRVVPSLASVGGDAPVSAHTPVSTTAPARVVPTTVSGAAPVSAPPSHAPVSAIAPARVASSASGVVSFSAPLSHVPVSVAPVVSAPLSHVPVSATAPARAMPSVPSVGGDVATTAKPVPDFLALHVASAAVGTCNVCGLDGGRHVCACGVWVERASYLYLHLHSYESRVCQGDPHRACEFPPGVCTDCGELFEENAIHRAQHVLAHKSGRFWCIECRWALPLNVRVVARHFQSVRHERPFVLRTERVPHRENTHAQVPVNAVCTVCGLRDGRHVCVCGLQCSRISILRKHIDLMRYDARARCKLDRHVAGAVSVGSCAACGEPYEADAVSAHMHRIAHTNGHFWCSSCRFAVTNNVESIERHFQDESHLQLATAAISYNPLATAVAAAPPPFSDAHAHESAVASDRQWQHTDDRADKGTLHVSAQRAGSGDAPVVARHETTARAAAAPVATARDDGAASRQTAAVSPLLVKRERAESPPPQPPPPPVKSSKRRSGADAPAKRNRRRLQPRRRRRSNSSSSDDDNDDDDNNDSDSVNRVDAAATNADSDVESDSGAAASDEISDADEPRAVAPPSTIRRGACKLCGLSDGQHVCGACGERLARISVIRAHCMQARNSACSDDPHRYHVDDVPHPCSHCGEELGVDQAKRRKHLKAHDEGYFWCSVCERSLRRYGWRAHLETKQHLAREQAVAPAASTSAAAAAPVTTAPTAAPTAAVAETTKKRAVKSRSPPARHRADSEPESARGSVAASPPAATAAAAAAAAAAVPCQICSGEGGVHVCVCGKEFSMISILLYHVRRSGCADPHTVKRGNHPRICKTCGEELETDVAQREQHQAAHTDGLFWCVVCHRSVGRFSRINDHLNSIRHALLASLPPSERATAKVDVRGQRAAPVASSELCDLCGSGGGEHICQCGRPFTMADLRDHFESQRAECRDDPHFARGRICVHCCEPFESDRDVRKQHIAAHLNKGAWCSVCEASFHSNAQKANHMRSAKHKARALGAVAPPSAAAHKDSVERVEEEAVDKEELVDEEEEVDDDEEVVDEAEMVDDEVEDIVEDEDSSDEDIVAFDDAAAAAATSAAVMAESVVTSSEVDEASTKEPFFVEEPLVDVVEEPQRASAPHRPDTCGACGRSDGTHVCSCGHEFSTIGALMVHRDVPTPLRGAPPDVTMCQADQHRNDLNRLLAAGADLCDVCGEALEAEPMVRQHHLMAHIGGFWCVPCRRGISKRMTYCSHVASRAHYDVESRFRAQHGRAALPADVFERKWNVVNVSELRSSRAATPISHEAALLPVPKLEPIDGDDAPQRGAGGRGGGAHARHRAVVHRVSAASEDSSVNEELVEASSGVSGASFVPRRRSSSAACGTCGLWGGRHVCSCGSEFVGIGVLRAHMRESRKCRGDPHAAAVVDGACDVCGERLEGDKIVRAQHAAVHAIGMFWCALCRMPVALSMKAIEWHMRINPQHSVAAANEQAAQLVVVPEPEPADDAASTTAGKRALDAEGAAAAPDKRRATASARDDNDNDGGVVVEPRDESAVPVLVKAEMEAADAPKSGDFVERLMSWIDANGIAVDKARELLSLLRPNGH